MNHTIRMTKSQFEAIKAIKGYIQASGLFPQAFDDKDVVNLLFHYFSSLPDVEKDLLFQQGKNHIQKPDLAKNAYPKFMEQLGILDMQEKPESKMMLLDDNAEKEIESIYKNTRENTTNIIKNLIFGFVVNPKKVTDIMIDYLFSQAFFFGSLDYIMRRYSFEQVKDDFVSQIPLQMEIKPVEIKNFQYVFNEIKSWTKYEDIENKFEMAEKDMKKIIDDMSSGVISIGSQTKSTLPPRLKLLDLFSSTVLAHVLPTLISHKLLSILVIYAGFKKDNNMIQPYTSVIDSTIPLILPNFKKEVLRESYSDISIFIAKHIDDWEKFVKDFEN